MNRTPKVPTSPPPTIPRSSTTPPPLARRDTGIGRPMNNRETEMQSATEPPPSVMPVQRTCNRPGCDKGCSHSYEEVVMTPPRNEVDDADQYEQLNEATGSDANLLERLKKVEDNQKTMLNNQDTIMKDMSDIKALLEKINKASNDALFKSMENSDHLGQQILHVRRDIQQSSTKREPKTFDPADYAQKERTQKRYVHNYNFEWQVQDTDFLIRNLKESSSQSFHISHIDFWLIAAANCNKEGRMYLEIFGDFTHMDPGEIGPRCARFACTVKAIDRWGLNPEFVLGKVAGDFHTKKQYMIGDVLLIDLKRKGLCPRGSLQLRYDIEVYA